MAGFIAGAKDEFGHYMNAEDFAESMSDMSGEYFTAEDEAKRMGDEYVSVEHIFLAMIQNPNKEIQEIFREYG
ncbi:MAG: Clp protease N-terminal domain-containing protein, partial [Clostridia bacterium]|nr:Clp protease N-terminal domain-containing protein [Clostridia bacterium]